MDRIDIQDYEPLDYAPGMLTMCLHYPSQTMTITYRDGHRKRIKNLTVRQLGKFMAVVWAWRNLSCIGPQGWIIYSHPDNKDE